jgi:soluble lytic murein transglycosylase-like protein
MSASEKYNLNPHLLAALIWWESGGNPLAYSTSGAVGLMQVMPRDGLAADYKCINGPCFADRPTIEELEVPEFNIEYGSRYLAVRIAKEGSLKDGLKGYGPANIGYYYADIILELYKGVKQIAFDEAGT